MDCTEAVQSTSEGAVHAAYTLDAMTAAGRRNGLRDNLKNRYPMRRALLCALAAVCLAGAAPKKPKLVLAIIVDQFRYDYLTRFRSEYNGGLARLLTQGAVFTHAS